MVTSGVVYYGYTLISPPFLGLRLRGLEVAGYGARMVSLSLFHLSARQPMALIPVPSISRQDFNDDMPDLAKPHTWSFLGGSG